LVWGFDKKNLPLLATAKVMHLGEIAIPSTYAAGFVMVTILLIALGLFFRYTKAGLAMRGVAEDQEVCQSLGVKVTAVYAQAWVISAFVAALGGIILGSITSVSPELTGLGLKVFPVVLLGGMDSIIGVACAGPIVGVIENLASGYLDVFVGGGMKEVAPFIILLLVLIIRPHGLFGLERIERI